MERLTIWCNRQFSPADAARFESAVTPHAVVWAAAMSASNLVAAPSDRGLVEDCEIAYGQPDPDDVERARKLKLICLSSAGYTRYDTVAFRNLCARKSIAVCNASGVYDEPCAQHALAMMLSTTRQLPQALASQFSSRGWPYLELRGRSEILGPASNILLVGYGSIARRLAQLLQPFGSALTAFRRSPRGDEVVPALEIHQLDSHLGSAHHVVNTLPETDSTRRFFDAARFNRFRPGAHFFNLGRGNTVDQAALEDALKSGRLGSAYLDVTQPEPLPGNHPLWTTPNCFITPHTAGGTADEAQRQIDHFKENVGRFASGRPLRDRIF